MKIFLTDQTKNLPKELEYFKKQAVKKYDTSKLIEKTTITSINCTKNLRDLPLDSFFNYEIFPLNILNHLTQWKYENRKIKVGDTIVQQVFIPPIRSFSQKIIFAVRICQVFNELTKVGFSYETVKGHIETGISTFTIEKDGSTNPVFKIHTFSAPGNILTKIGSVFSIPYQTFCTHQALKEVKNRIEMLCK